MIPGLIRTPLVPRLAVRPQSGCMEKVTAISQEFGCRFGEKKACKGIWGRQRH